MKKICLFFKKEFYGIIVGVNAFLALISLFTKKYTVALAYIDKSIDYYDEIKDLLTSKEICNDILYGIKSDIYAEMENYDEALIFINKAIEINPKSLDFYESRAEILYSLKDYKNAVNDYTMVLEDNPKALKFLINISKADNYYCRAVSKSWLENYKGAIEDFTKAIELKPKNYLYFLERGKAKMWCDDFSGAIDDYTNSIKLHPNHYGTYFERAKAYYNLGNKNLAMTDINFAINLMKDGSFNSYTDGEIFSTKASLLFEKDKDKALDFLIEVQKNCRKDKDKLYVVLSYIFFSYDNYRKALKYANLAILNNRKNADAYYRKKCALDALGRKDEARECYEKAIKLGYQGDA